MGKQETASEMSLPVNVCNSTIISTPTYISAAVAHPGISAAIGLKTHGNKEKAACCKC